MQWPKERGRVGQTIQCPLSFGHCIICPTLPLSFGHCIICPTPPLSFGHCIVCPTPPLSVGHCIVCPTLPKERGQRGKNDLQNTTQNKEYRATSFIYMQTVVYNNCETDKG
jgi:hypothetical protein